RVCLFFFFSSRRRHTRSTRDWSSDVCSSDLVRLQFYRAETADCSERLVFEQFAIDVPLPAFETTTVEFTPSEAGEYRFRCGMNMLKGLLVVEPATADRRPSASPHKFHD